MGSAAAEALAFFLSSRPGWFDAPGDIVFLRARAFPELRRFHPKRLCCVQSFKPDAAELEALGFSVSPVFPAGRVFDLAVCLPGRQREENLWNFALCLNVLKGGGRLLCSMENELGAGRFEKKLAELAGNIESFSKHKCRVFYAEKGPGLDAAVLGDWLKKGELSSVPGTALVGRAGVFGRKKIDRGSELLCGHLPEDLPGRGADLGAGWGYLSERVLEKARSVLELHLYEAEHLALETARANLAGKGAGVNICFHWHDVAQGLPEKDYDWIVMNPPLHREKRAEPALVEKFIAAAAGALRPEGRLYMVTGGHVPCRQGLERRFSDAAILAEESGFKVVEARK